MDYLVIGSVPYDEPCQQVPYDDPVLARLALRCLCPLHWLECKAFANQLVRILGPPPEGASLQVKSFPHDFGTYCEVVCWYDENNDKAAEYAYRCESECPANWDEEAREELTHVNRK
jgi:hypothetical protein